MSVHHLPLIAPSGQPILYTLDGGGDYLPHLGAGMGGRALRPRLVPFFEVMGQAGTVFIDAAGRPWVHAAPARAGGRPHGAVALSAVPMRDGAAGG